VKLELPEKQRKQRHSLKLGKKRRESSKRNYYIISPRVIIKAIIIRILLTRKSLIRRFKGLEESHQVRGLSSIVEEASRKRMRDRKTTALPVM